ncbi:MAG TPA: DUF2231 domain-containing protein [Candidatus Sulfotelmatobacter sp.]|nr:DUF2231 domain-containing protein [Candidatus Sulfotelmatobacter sp.]
MTTEIILGAGILPALKQFVMATKLHPILVNFTSALVPVSVASDFLGRFCARESFRSTGWWTLFYATMITPFTAITGWLFWMPDDNGAHGMAIHKWLGSALAVLLFGLFAWRLQIYRQAQSPTGAYFLFGAIFIAALVYQGYLGGTQVFSGM